MTVNTTTLQGIADPSSITVGSLGLSPTGSDGTGTPTFDIDLTLIVDAGTSDIGFVASGTLTATGNPFDGSSITLTTDTNFATNCPDFNNLNSARVVSLLGQVAICWLDGLRGGDLISSINIPFVEGGLDKILDLAEVLSDALLFDEGPDTSDPTGTLADVGDGGAVGDRLQQGREAPRPLHADSSEDSHDRLLGQVVQVGRVGPGQAPPQVSIQCQG